MFVNNIQTPEKQINYYIFLIYKNFEKFHFVSLNEPVICIPNDKINCNWHDILSVDDCELGVLQRKIPIGLANFDIFQRKKMAAYLQRRQTNEYKTFANSNTQNLHVHSHGIPKIINMV